MKKKSSGVKSGDLGGQAVGPPLPTQRPGNVSPEMWYHFCVSEAFLRGGLLTFWHRNLAFKF
jgi:hypothetical protein